MEKSRTFEADLVGRIFVLFTTIKAFYNDKYNKKNFNLSFRMGTNAQNLEYKYCYGGVLKF